MPTSPSISLSKSTTASAGGAGSVTFQNTLAGHTWHVRLLSATSNGWTVNVLRNGVQVIDSTANDTRPTVTSDSRYDLAQMETVVVTWAGATAGAALVATLTYDDQW